MKFFLTIAFVILSHNCFSQQLQGSKFIYFDGYVLKTIKPYTFTRTPFNRITNSSRRGISQLINDSLGNILVGYGFLLGTRTLLGEPVRINFFLYPNHNGNASMLFSIPESNNRSYWLLGRNYFGYDFRLSENQQGANNKINAFKININNDSLEYDSLKGVKVLRWPNIYQENLVIPEPPFYVDYPSISINMAKLGNKFKIYTVRKDLLDFSNNRIYITDAPKDTGFLDTLREVYNLPDTFSARCNSKIIISPNQKRMAVIREKGIYLFDIDSINGNLSFRYKIPFFKKYYSQRIFQVNGLTLVPFPVYEGCFSPDNSKLYILANDSKIGNDTGLLYRINIDNNSVLEALQSINSKTLINSKRLPFFNNAFMQITLSGEIVICNSPYDYLNNPRTSDSSLFIPNAYFIKCPNSSRNFIELDSLSITERPQYDGSARFTPPFLASYVFENANKLQVIAGQRTLCIGDTTQLQAFGATAQTFVWDNNPNLSSTIIGNPVFTASTAGNYTLRVTASSTCTTAVALISIRVLDSLNANLGADVRPCSGSSVTLRPPNQPSGVTYLWNTGATTPSITVSSAGTYSVTLRAGSCVSVDSIRVLQPYPPVPPPVLEALSPDSVCTPSFVRVGIQAADTSRYKYIWSNGFNGTVQNFASTETFTVFAQDKVNRCFSTVGNRKVTVFPLPSAGIAGVNEVCPGSENMRYQLVNPVNVDTVKWFCNQGTIIRFDNQSAFINWQGVESDTAKVGAILISANGCSDTISFPVILRIQLKPAKPIGDTAYCLYKNDTSYRAYLGTNYQQNATFNWSANRGRIRNQGNNPAFVRYDSVGTDSLSYSATIITPLQTCFGQSKAIAITRFQQPDTLQIFNSNSTGDTICIGQDDSVFSISTQRKEGYRYNWLVANNLGDSITFPDSVTQFALSNTFPADYEISLQYFNKNQCEGPLLRRRVSVLDQPFSSLVSQNRYICPEDLVRTYNVLEGVSRRNYNYRWRITGGTIVSPDSNSAEITVLWSASKFPRQVYIQIVDKYGCFSIADSISIRFDSLITNPNSGCDLGKFPLIPNNFISANDDGINETLIIPNLEFYGKNTLTVINRWGQVVHKQSEYKNEVLPILKTIPEGVYYYLFETERGTVKGWFMLLR